MVAHCHGLPGRWVPAQAQTPGKIDLEAAEMAAEFIGAPVFARDGAQVGEVADIAFDDTFGLIDCE
jgi:hypothetical protein